jgi:hypothetical protein
MIPRAVLSTADDQYSQHEGFDGYTIKGLLWAEHFPCILLFNPLGGSVYSIFTIKDTGNPGRGET